MNEVFKTIVPHTATPNKKNLSYNAMRVNTYNAEKNDTEAAVEALEKIIKTIRSYIDS